MSDKRFKPELLDPDKLIKVNDLQPVTNPVFFVRNNVPTSDGLLSNEIFGITKDDRSNTFAYIDLSETFMNPLCYKKWSRLDGRIKEIVHGTKKFIVNDKGDFEESENGKNGIKFLQANIDNIKIKATKSSKRDRDIIFLKKNMKDTMFVSKVIVIPAYFRDVETDAGYVGVGEINKIYNSIIVSVNSLKESVDYGLTMIDSTRGRIQELLVHLYNWLVDEPNISKKKGILRRAILTKTTDYGSRLVMSAPDLKAERLEDLTVDLDHSAVPLASVCANFFPIMIFYVRRFFENEFAGQEYYSYEDKKGELQRIKIKDYQVAFSETEIKKEMERFMFGYSNRFIPIKIPNDEGLDISMVFKGKNITSEEYVNNPDKVGTMPILDRDLTWCDIFYIAAVESVKDRTILITRYPIDSYFNQFPTKVVVSSTKKTEPMVINSTFYKKYPKIRQEDIGTNTSNLFIDTLNICNAFLPGIGGDYDGDQCSIKGLYSVEANEEAMKFMNSNAHYISLGAKNIRTMGSEGIQTLYCLTKVLPETQDMITKSVFK